MHEAAYWPSSGFVTLTYRDEDLPANGSLERVEFTKFLKRLRKELGSRRIRYYACGEYGEELGRPHYHLIVFGLEPCTCDVRQSPVEYCKCSDREKLMDVWSHGGVDRIGTVTYQSCRYVADYIGKEDTARPKDFYELRERPFHAISYGIGRRYVDDHERQLRQRQGVTVQGVQVGLPRYYRERLKKGGRLDWINRERPVIVPSKRAWHFIGKAPEVLAEVERPREQMEKDAKARQSLTRKGDI